MLVTPAGGGMKGLIASSLLVSSTVSALSVVELIHSQPALPLE